MVCVSALIWLHQYGSQGDTIQTEEKTPGINIGILIKEGNLNWKETKLKRFQNLQVWPLHKKSSAVVYWVGVGGWNPAMKELQEAQKEVYKGQNIEK